MSTADIAAPPTSAASVPSDSGRLEIDRFFQALVKFQGSDLHLKVGQPPIIRVKGSLQPLKTPPIDDEQMRRLCLPMLNERNQRILEVDGGCDFAHMATIDGVRWRFRVNLLTQQGSLGLVARRVNNSIPNFEGLHLPPAIARLCEYDQGMILLAGVTGSGKSTTIASMLQHINQHHRKHILTLEDPIEFVFTEDKCLINQREVGQDVKDFAIGMKHAVREDPDIILVGEMRDEETFMTAIHAAETGHLVFGTIHASSAATTIGRILDLFPEEMHGALRSAIANNMKGIVAQKLVKAEGPKAKELGVSRVPAVEIMFFDVMVRKLVLEGEDDELPEHIRKSHRDGMQDFTMSLKSLIDQDLIDRKDALEIAPNREALTMALKGIGVS
ncbi:MAG: PilT/PilU family type 4a pilus ATPase [Planctomycetota bacterium]|jgi:twitching motility protein PilT|nr:PilT/PilU family type 4a pilus ATPase [Planctomycetota bacterium]MDA1200378.1 PilT/PilU family type 4a pilus ATPase [Planctomycetota bacterium]